MHPYLLYLILKILILNKVRKRAKIRNRYNQVPHLTKDTTWELQLNEVNSFDTETTCLDLNLPITNGIVSSKIYDKRDDFTFEIINFSFLNGDAPRSPSYGVYISQLIRFARVHSNRNDFLIHI